MKRLHIDNRNSKRRLAGPKRSGAFLIVAMVCLVLVGSLLGTLLKMVSLGREQAVLSKAALQADWLLESSLDRAAAKLQSDEAYQGETWNVSSKELGGPYAGRAVIHVLPGKGSDMRIIEAQALYPLDETPSIKRTKRMTVRLSKAAPRKPTSETTNPDSSPASAEKPAGG